LERHTLSARLRYAFDNFMSRGTFALVVGLFAASGLLILGISLVVTVLGGLDSQETAGVNFVDLVWMSLLRTLDPGTMGGDAGTLVFVGGMFIATLGGLFLVAILIGLISSGIEGKLTELRKGRSRVIERDHTVVLGWSPQVFTLISELVEANSSKRNQRIVVLADRDKVAMEDEIRARVPNTRTTRVVCRSGSPIDPDDIDITSPQTARSIVILAPETVDSDAEVIKSLMAVTKASAARSRPGHVVATLEDERNLDVARMAAQGQARIMLGGELIARIAALACRQPGLSVVYEDLLDFAGDEIYFVDETGLAGTSFGEALHAFRDSALLGVARVDGPPLLNPPMARPIAPGERLIVLASDDSTVRTAPRPDGMPVEARIRDRIHAAPHPERTLVLGLSRRAAAMLLHLDRYVAPGSAALVVSPIEGDREAAERLAAALSNMTLAFASGDTTSRGLLDQLLAQGWDHAVLMSPDGMPAQRADARTMVTLLHLRDICDRSGQPLAIVTEMLDLRNRDLAQSTGADDFIVSEKLVSQMLAQLAESPELESVFGELFSAEGSEIYLRPARDYVALGEPLDFYTVVESARRRGEVAFGYRLQAHAHDPSRGYGVVLNPDKAAAVALGEGDLIAVLAED
jgi:ion channel POLLUX/CASTOR